MQGVFLVIYHNYKPAKNVKTQIKDYQDEQNSLVCYESVSITDSLKNKHITESTFIIDLATNQFVKNRKEAEVNTYIEKYREHIITFFTKKYPNMLKVK